MKTFQSEIDLLGQVVATSFCLGVVGTCFCSQLEPPPPLDKYLTDDG